MTKRKLPLSSATHALQAQCAGQQAGFINKMQECETLQECERLKNSHAQADSELEEVLPSSYNVHPSKYVGGS